MSELTIQQSPAGQQSPARQQTPAGAESRQWPQPGTYDIDASHSDVELVARHLMVSKVRGRFGSFSGTIKVDPDPRQSSVTATVDAASIDTRDERRDGHLRSDDFLAVDRYPTIEFRSTGLDPNGDSWKVHGDLTIRDVTRPVTLDLTFEGSVVDPYGNARLAVSAAADIDREDWGLTWNQALDSGGVILSRKVRLEVGIEAIRRA